MEWTLAGRAHDCRFNKSHRLEKGQRRLTVKSDGDEHHYCVSCAKKFLTIDIQRLQDLLEKADADTSEPISKSTN
jgi:ribosomal protein L24E